MERIKRALEKARSGAGVAEALLAPPTGGGVKALTEKVPTKAQVAAVDPSVLERHRIIASDKQDPRTAAFDMLRTRVLHEMRPKGFRSLAITSPTAGCGKTTVAINLAFSLAQMSDASVTLVDFDLRQPKIGKYLGLRAVHDLGDFLDGRVSVAEALIDLGIPGLLVLANARSYNNAAETLSTHQIKHLVKHLNDNDPQGISLFDLPPLLTTDDAIAFLPQVDRVLLIVADGLTKKAELQESLRLLQGSNLLGVVLNMADVRPHAYY
jgi:hypothetical protein